MLCLRLLLGRIVHLLVHTPFRRLSASGTHGSTRALLSFWRVLERLWKLLWRALENRYNPKGFPLSSKGGKDWQASNNSGYIGTCQRSNVPGTDIALCSMPDSISAAATSSAMGSNELLEPEEQELSITIPPPPPSMNIIPKPPPLQSRNGSLSTSTPLSATETAVEGRFDLNLSPGTSGDQPTPSHDFSHQAEVARPSSFTTAAPFGGSHSSVRVSNEIDEFTQLTKTIYCIYSDRIERYSRKIRLKKEINKDLIIGAMQRAFQRNEPGQGWKSAVHPEGQLYFYQNIEKDQTSRRYITEANLNNKKTMGEINLFLKTMERHISALQDFISEVEVVLELLPEGWGYYMVDHTSQCLFWINEFEPIEQIGTEIEGIRSLSHIKHWVDQQYWKHWELFPIEKNIPNQVVSELMGALLHGSIDLMTSSDSTVPWDKTEITTLVNLVNTMNEHGSTYAASSIAPALARLMWVSASERFLNFHGHPGARLSRVKSVYGDTKGRRTFLITLLSPLLYSAPDVHLRELEKVWVDAIVTIRYWKQHVQNLNSEWSQVVINLCFKATVLLNANVAFLAIPLISTSPSDASSSGPSTITMSSPGQIASLLSIIASMGSVIIGLVLLRQHQTKSKDTATQASIHLKKRESARFGLEPLAIMFSLPFALLMWGMVTFFAAVAFLCFQAVQNIAQWAVTAVAWVIILATLIWVIVTNWEPGGNTKYSFLHNIRRLHLDQVVSGEEPTEEQPAEDDEEDEPEDTDGADPKSESESESDSESKPKREVDTSNDGEDPQSTKKRMCRMLLNRLQSFKSRKSATENDDPLSPV